MIDCHATAREIAARLESRHRAALLQLQVDINVDSSDRNSEVSPPGSRQVGTAAERSAPRSSHGTERE
jgi:hypothetical protein